MQHFANFGYIKKANKQLKNLQEIKQGLSVRLGRISNEASSSNSDIRSDALNYLTGNGDRVAYAKNHTRKRRAEQNKADIDPLTKRIGTETHPYYGGTFVEDYNTQRLPKTGWSDIRKTDDRATSSTGYLGFRTDPFKGYGGMMEEAIPLRDFPITKKYYSRLTGNTI